MTGVLNVRKPVGPTSHDVVARVRRILGIRRVGHSGTLDPLADGVLLVCVGQATRLVEYLNDLPKQYLADLLYGVVTDTQDLSGTILERRDAGHLTRAVVAAELARFRGRIEQVPPMYSALKVDGKPLYERARRGEVVERAPRPVEIYCLELRDFTAGPEPVGTLDVTCSSGTYVRTLCHDLGARLGTGAAMAALTRTAIGEFRVEHAASLEELGQRQAAGEPLPWIAPADAVAHLPAVTASRDQALALRQGKHVSLAGQHGAPAVRVLDDCRRLVAIGRPAADGFLAPEKVFAETPPEASEETQAGE